MPQVCPVAFRARSEVEIFHVSVISMVLFFICNATTV